MGKKKIHELPHLESELDGNAVIPISQDGQTYHIKVDELQTNNENVNYYQDIVDNIRFEIFWDNSNLCKKIINKTDIESWENDDDVAIIGYQLLEVYDTNKNKIVSKLGCKIINHDFENGELFLYIDRYKPKSMKFKSDKPFVKSGFKHDLSWRDDKPYRPSEIVLEDKINYLDIGTEYYFDRLTGTKPMGLHGRNRNLTRVNDDVIYGHGFLYIRVYLVLYDGHNYYYGKNKQIIKIMGYDTNSNKRSVKYSYKLV